jgi:hypothetical protein
MTTALMMMLCLGVVGCTSSPQDQPEPSSSKGFTTGADPSSEETLDAEWVLTAHTIGPVRLGMTTAELQSLDGIILDTTGAEIGSWGFQHAGARVGIEGFARGIDEVDKVCAFLPEPYFRETTESVVPTRGLATEAGARLGQTSAEFEAVYPDGEWVGVLEPSGGLSPRFVVVEDGLFMSFGTTAEYVTEVAISTHDQPIGCVEN